MLIFYLKNTKFFKRLKFDYVKFLAKFNKSLYMKIKGKNFQKYAERFYLIKFTKKFQAEFHHLNLF